MIVFAIVGTVAAIVWSFLVFGANSMSDAPMDDFKGGGLLILIWVVVAILWFAWYIG